jgi:hypothetical protein
MPFTELSHLYSIKESFKNPSLLINKAPVANAYVDIRYRRDEISPG